MSLRFSHFDDDFNNHLFDLKRILPDRKEPDADVQARIIQMAGSGAGISKFDIERLFGTNDLLRFNYLHKGIIAGKAVARVRINSPFGAGGSWGTGFLITPRLLITNNHVIRSAEEARLAVVEFDYQTDLHNYLQPGTAFRLRPDLTFITDDETNLDYTIVAIEQTSIDRTARAVDYGFVRLLRETHKVDALEYVSIIQHPNGEEKCIAIRENKVIKIGDAPGGLKDNFIWYVCDTAVGSSGAPVFNDQWQLVALHHRSVAPTKIEDGTLKIQLKNGAWIEEINAAAHETEIQFVANEGIRISKIFEDLKIKHAANYFSYIQELIEDAEGIRIIPGTIPKESIVAGPLPALETDRLPGIQPSVQPTSNIRQESYYNGRKGYDANFLLTEIGLPILTEKALSFGAVAEVKSTTDNVLRYMHFSIVFNADRKLPFFTAVNIDGNTWNTLSRGADKWYFDSRIPTNLQIGNDFYSGEPQSLGQKGWFDRGHLVRRLDPVWGTREEALLADEDSFHWTNCAPQYWAFNQGNQLWQGLENYILYNTDEENVKATVFTGPIFSSDDEVHRGIMIPQFYWKVVVVEDKTGQLYSSAYVADQSAWARDIPFEELPIGKYQNYQVPLTKLESATGLKFSAPLMYADVLKGKADLRLRSLAEIVHPKR